GRCRCTPRSSLTLLLKHYLSRLSTALAPGGFRVTMTIPAGAFGNDREITLINESWSSDDLQVLVKSSNSDPRYGVTTYELTNIVRVAPDPILFQVLGDYIIRNGPIHSYSEGSHEKKP